MSREQRRWLLLVVGVIIIVLGPLALGQIFQTKSAQAAWANEDWGYRQKVAITNSGSAQTDFQVSLTLDTATLITAGKLQSDCDDIRITDINGKLLPHWIEEVSGVNCNNSGTLIWTKVSSIPTSGATIYIYYGNPSATNKQNGNNVFDFFDDFNDNSMDTNKWSEVYYGIYPGWSEGTTNNIDANETGGQLRVNGTANVNFHYGKAFKTARTFTASSSNPLRVDYTKVSLAGTGTGTGAEVVLTNGSTMVRAGQSTQSGEWYATTGTQFADTEYSTTRRVSLHYDNTNAKLDRDGTTIISQGAVSSLGAFTAYLGSNVRAAGDTGDVYFDNFRIRKSASTEPTVASPSSEEKAPSPVAYWKFDDGTGTTAQDSITNNNDGTLSGATWQTEDMCVSGKCLYFDGVNDYVNIPDVNALDFGTGDFSYSFWIKTTSSPASGAQLIYKRGSAGENNAGYNIALLSGGTLQAAIDDGPTAVPITTTRTINNGSWHFISVVMDRDGNGVIYIDGTQDASAAISSATNSVSNTTALGIGRNQLTADQYFNGFIDEPKIYNYARSAEQIKADYNARANSEGAAGVLGTASNNNYKALNDGLVGYWKMDESSWTNDCTATSVTDASGNGNNGKACPATTGPTGGAAGKFGNAGSFDGSDDYVSLSDTALPATPTTFTMAGWFKTSVGGGIINRYGTTGGGGYRLVIWSGNLLFTIDNGTYYNLFGTTTVTDNAWHHAAATWDGTTMRLYLDGKLEGSQAGVNPTSGGANIAFIGRNKQAEGAGQAYFGGSLDEIRMYNNRALSPAEVSQLYNFAPGPVAYYNFEEGTGTTANDTSGNGNTGTLTNGPTWGTGKYGKALNFDGSDDYVISGSNINISGDKDMSLGAWVKFNSVAGGSHRAIVDFGNTGSAGAGFGIFQGANGSGSITVGFYGNTNCSTSSSTVTTDIWYHLAAIKTTGAISTSTVKLYINGVSQTLTCNSSITPNITAGPFYVGSDGANEVSNNMIIDEAKAYNYARTQQQIIEDMSNGFDIGGSGYISSFSTTGGSIAKPVGYWRFDEGYGTTANNVGNSGSSINGTLTNMASPATSTSGWTQSGKFGKALSFDGSNDYVTMGDTALDGLSQFTISAWVKINSHQQFAGIVQKHNTDSDDTVLITGGSGVGDNQSVIQTIRAGSNTYGLTAAGTLQTGQWYHIVSVFDGTQSTNATRLKIYLNGIQQSLTFVGTIPSTTTSNSANLEIGRYTGTSGTTLNGQIDEVKVYNFALTADQVKMDMNQGAAAVYGALGTSTSHSLQAASQEYCIPGDTATCTAPVGRWDFEEGTGTTANDTSGNGNTGTLTNGPTWGTGKYGKALNFDGSDDRVQVTSSSGDALDLTTNMTVSAWINPTAIHDINNYIVSRRNSTNGYGYSMYLNNEDDKFRAIITTSAGNCGDANSTTTINTNTWYHVSFTYDGTNLRYYINGRPENVISCTQTSPSQSTNFLIGIYNDLAAQYAFNGKIDQVRIFNYARSASQIAWDYNKGAPVGHWRLDECQGTTANDASGNSNTGTITIGASGTQTSAGTCTDGASAWYNGRTGKRNYSLNFDGSDDYINVAHNSNLNLTNFTVSAWVRLSSLNNYFFVVTKTLSTGSSANNYELRTNPSNQVQLVGNGGTSITSTSTLATGAWYHLVGTYDGTTSRVYINGVADGTSTSISYSTTSTALKIGSRDDLYTYFPGQIDDVKIYNYALTATQVKNLMNEGAVRYGPVTGAP